MSKSGSMSVEPSSIECMFERLIEVDPAADESAIDADMQAFAREVLKPLVDPDFDPTPPRI